MEKISSYPSDKISDPKLFTKGTEIEIKDISSPGGRHYKQHRIHCSTKTTQQVKSQDSGFSDSADSTEDQKSSNSSNSPKILASSNISPSSSSSISSNASNTSHEEINVLPNTSSSAQKHSINRRQSQIHDYSLTNSSEEETEQCANDNKISIDSSSGTNDVRSEVVHETRTNAYEPHKQYHVSKVYFYSVSDMILNGEGTEEANKIRCNPLDLTETQDYFHEGSYNHFEDDGNEGESYVDNDFNDDREGEESHISILDCETGKSLLPRKDQRRSVIRNQINPNDVTGRSIDSSMSTTNASSARDEYNVSSTTHRPPPPQRISSLSNREESFDTSYDSIPMVKLDPNACDMILSDNEQQPVFDISNSSSSPGPSQYYFMEHKPLRPVDLKNSSKTFNEGVFVSNRGTSPMSSYFPETSDVSTNSATGNSLQYNPCTSTEQYASSLKRPTNNYAKSPTALQSNIITSHSEHLSFNGNSSSVVTSPHGRAMPPSRSSNCGSGFPKTNGALLYESLSLGRPTSRGIIKEPKRGHLPNYNTLSDYHIQR